MAHGARDRRVLIVEDEAMVTMLIEDMMQELGWTVAATAATVDQAAGCLDADAIDLAVLDVNLRGEYSYPVADALSDRGIPYLFITGYGQVGLASPYCDQPVLQKPFTKDALAKALCVLMD